MRYAILFLLATAAYAEPLDIDLAVAKAHHDHWAKVCKAKPHKEAKQCVADLEKSYAQAQKDIKDKHKGDAK